MLNIMYSEGLPRYFRCWGLAAGLVVLGCGTALAQDGTAPANQPDAPVPAPVEVTPAEEELKPGLTVGTELYYGFSNLTGAHRYRDGFWTGAGPNYPSNVYGIYNGTNGTTAKLAVSLGKVYNGSVSNFDQPIEAYVSKAYHGINFTTGKFYVPFELAEWEYETELGVQAARDWGKNGSLMTAVTLNRNRDAANGYFRYARSIGIATVGVSLGAGQGFSYDTDHNQGVALDLTLEKGRFSLGSSVFTARKIGIDSDFQFAFARLNYSLHPKTDLYISRHSWSDRLDQQGNGHYSTLGAVFRLNKNLALEGGIAHSGELDRNIRSIQVHYTVEH
jgi:hypothetical protein